MIVQRICTRTTGTVLIQVEHDWPDFTPSAGRSTYIMSGGTRNGVHHAWETTREQIAHSRGPVTCHLAVEQFL